MEQQDDYKVLNGQLVFKPAGVLTFYNVAPFSTSIRNALEETGAVDVVIDCSELSLLDSSALGALAGIAKQLRDVEGQVKLADVMNSVTAGLFSLRLDRIMPIFNSVEEALYGKACGSVGHHPLKPHDPEKPKKN